MARLSVVIERELNRRRREEVSRSGPAAFAAAVIMRGPRGRARRTVAPTPRDGPGRSRSAVAEGGPAGPAGQEVALYLHTR